MSNNPDSPSPATRILTSLRGCANQRAPEMAICEPWTFTPNVPDSALKDKAAFKSWSGEKTTNHLFYSASEALNPAFRVNKRTNPLKCLHGLITDYDHEILEV